MILAWITMILQVIATAFLVFHFDGKFPDRVVTFHWAIHHFGRKDSNGSPLPSSYNGFIPVEILSDAVRIRKAHPDCSFYIEQLVREEFKIPKPDPDPFMKVTLGSENYYIGVWDEREFMEEKKLQAFS